MVNKLKKATYLSAGLVCSGLAIIAVLVPIMPMSPFTLLALYFFARTSRRFDSWIHNHRILGRYMRPASDKISAVKNNLRARFRRGSGKGPGQ